MKKPTNPSAPVLSARLTEFFSESWLIFYLKHDVQINMKHPDFLTRIKVAAIFYLSRGDFVRPVPPCPQVSKTASQPIVTERLCGYKRPASLLFHPLLTYCDSLPPFAGTSPT